MVKDGEAKKIIEGTVFEALKGALFRVRLDSENEVLAHISGKMRLHHIKVLLGDRVKVEVSDYDLLRGRIIQRL